VFARERQQQIFRLVEEHGRVLVADLATRFGVSEVTIRKDLLTLEAERRLVRTHGGAISVAQGRPELAFDVRRRFEAEAKGRIGAAAASLVQSGDTIAFDASTTALEVARRLRERGGWRDLTVITNGIRIAEELAGQDGITILMPGGRMRWEALSVVGPWGDGFFRRINVHRAFVGAAGFTIQAGLTDATEEEAQIKRAMVTAAAEVTGIIDHTKWGRAALATFCRTDRIVRLITDAPAPPDLVDAVDRAGIALIEAAPEPEAASQGAGGTPGRPTVIPEQASST
jgi:DeoR/GlpR family transcriptional regulator of sugar metabolism